MDLKDVMIQAVGVEKHTWWWRWKPDCDGGRKGAVTSRNSAYISTIYFYRLLRGCEVPTTASTIRTISLGNFNQQSCILLSSILLISAIACVRGLLRLRSIYRLSTMQQWILCSLSEELFVQAMNNETVFPPRCCRQPAPFWSDLRRVIPEQDTGVSCR